MKKAFTLAEVLIAITILGVIAAISMPAIMTNIDKNTWANGLKINMSVLNNGFKQMMAQEGVEDLRDTSLWAQNVSKEVNTSNTEINSAMKKHFKIEKIASNWPVKSYKLDKKTAYSNTSIRYYLGNSATINVRFLYDASYNDCAATQLFCHPVAEIILDVNGDKRPNVIGKDIYFLLLGENGNIYPFGGDAAANYSSSYKRWNTTSGCSGKQPTTDGTYCAGRVADENFSINYN